MPTVITLGHINLSPVITALIAPRVWLCLGWNLWDGQARELRLRAGEREKDDLHQENIGQAIQLERLGLGISGNGQEAIKKKITRAKLRILVTYGQTFLVLVLAMNLC